MRQAHAAGVLAALLLVAPAALGQTPILDVLGASGAGRNVLAPTPGPASMPPLSRPIDPAEYVVGPGDILQINLSGGVTRSWDATVLPEGTLYVPSAGSIPVTGLTLLEARRTVLARISKDYRGVTIDLRLMRPRQMLVYLIGETTVGGAHEVSAASRVSEVLADALFLPNGSRRNVELRRRTPKGETTIRLDLTRFRLTGYLAHDPLLREGDVLFIPRVSANVWVEGAVGRAGQYELAAGDSLSTLFELAAGPLPSAADRAVLVRFVDATHTDSLTFQVSDVVSRRFNVPLSASDRAFVYYQPRYHLLEQVSILGEVQRPGAYPLLPGFSRLSHLVNASGGFLPTADRASIRVFRSHPGAGEADPEITRLAGLGRREMTTTEYEVLRARIAARRPDFRVDWNKVKPEGDLDVTLRTGDIVRVDPFIASVRVEGEVRLPGLIGYEPGRKVSDYVRLAGGFSERASQGKVRVKRAGTDQTILAKDISGLEPGDLVWVPERGDPANWQNLQTVLLVAAQVATIMLALRAF